jgi:hypothetical protein
MKKWAKELNRAFAKEEVNMAKKTHEKKKTHDSTSLLITEMQIKTTLTSNSLLLEYLPSRTPTATNARKDAGKMKPSYTAGENIS